MNTCVCGRKIPIRFNSTIQAKQCPSCTYAEATRSKGSKKKQVNEPQRRERKLPVKWRDKPTSEMITYVQTNIVNPYIRERDLASWGLSISDRGQIAHAGHYYSIGAKPGMRFNPQNIHGQSVSGNMHKSGDIHNYRAGLIARYGENYVRELELQAVMSEGFRSLDRLNVIIIAETYLHLRKAKIWVFTLHEFNKYLNILRNDGQRFNS